MNKALLFGGSGFIGSHMLKMNAVSGFIFDIKKSIIGHKGFEYVDVRNPINTRHKPTPQDVIFNLAAVLKNPGHEPEEYYKTNMLCAENVCDYARTHGINTIVFTSTMSVYGTSEGEKTEESLPMPDTPYGISKRIAELIHEKWLHEDIENRKLIIVRPVVVFGQWEDGNYTRLLHAIHKNRFFYPGRKDTIKASIYVKDLAKALFELPEKLSNGLHLYNAGNLKNPTITEVVKAMANETKKSSNVLVLNKKLLLLAGFVLKNFFGKKEYDPDRIKKLTISTNINSKKLHKLVKFDFSLEEGIKDWLKDINSKKSP
jgi:nucleoside-diphosphate-sugar epimerase